MDQCDFPTIFEALRETIRNSDFDEERLLLKLIDDMQSEVFGLSW